MTSLSTPTGVVGNCPLPPEIFAESDPPMRNASISTKGVGCDHAHAADALPLQARALRAWLSGAVIHVASPHGRTGHDDFSNTVVGIHAVLNIHQPNRTHLTSSSPLMKR